MRRLNKKLKVSTENRGIRIFPNYLFGVVLTSGLKNILGIEYPPMFCEYWNNSNRWANDIEAANKNAKKLLSILKRDVEFARKIIDKFYTSEQDLKKISSKIRKLNLSKCSNQKLSKLFKTFINFYSKALAYGWLPIACEGFNSEFSKLLKKFLSKKLKGDEELVSRYFIYLTTPKKTSARQKAERMIINFVMKKKQSLKVVNTFIKKYLERYQWLNYDYQGPALSKKDVLDLIGEVANREEKKEKTKLDIDFIREDLLYYRLFKTAQEFMYVKNRKQETLFYSHFCLDKLLFEIGRKLKLILAEIRSMRVEEIQWGLKRNIVNREEIRERSGHSVLVFWKKKLDIIVGEKRIKDFLNENLIKERIKKVSQIEGQAACVGKVKGRVAVVNSIEDIGKMQKGDILVSSKTNPSFMAAIKKAGAIITDYGGITCHAAIISRELGIPCVIGTKIATQALKDGDRVEVDADKGVVRKIL